MGNAETGASAAGAVEVAAAEATAAEAAAAPASGATRPTSPSTIPSRRNESRPPSDTSDHLVIGATAPETAAGGP
ncbi:hypothetical protein [Synechococcus sp. CS-1328]|uniref:hypothetical protein n=1 Tax=Synechococcus sp. CS-1328 TaxID=2847976 RepID=UPI00223A6AE4|nr:hypothetical protein [Synechococcus sp. CS-1328]